MARFTIWNKLVVIMVAALGVQLVFASTTQAGGPIMAVYTYVSGTDRVKNIKYDSPRKLFTNNLIPQTLRVYQGDTVTFDAKIVNYDPIPIPGLVNAEVHKWGWGTKNTSSDKRKKDTPVGGSDTLLANSVKKDLYPTGPWSAWWWSGNNMLSSLSWTETITGAGTDTPGNILCYYGQTDPTVYDVTTGLFFLPVVVEGLHKFNTHHDTYNVTDSLFFNLLTFGGINIEGLLGDMMSCVEIAYVYDLMPAITPKAGSGSGTVTVSPAVGQNQGSDSVIPKDRQATASQPTRWQIEQFYLPYGDVPASLAKPTTTQKSPCDYFSGLNLGVQGCVIPLRADNNQQAKSNGANTTFDKSGLPRPGGSDFPGSLVAPVSRAGMMVCYSLSVSTYQPYQSDPNWRNSTVRCLTDGVSKSPKVVVTGGDIRVGGKIDTSLSTAADQSGQPRNFGSWAEYASFSGLNSPVKSDTSWGKTIGFATKSGLVDGVSTADQQSKWSVLTFANSPQFEAYSPGTAGEITRSTGQVRTFFDGKSAAQPVPSSGSVDISGLPANKVYSYSNNDTLDISASSEIPVGKYTVIIASGKVRITGDIRYSAGPIHGIGGIPQVVIIASEISVNADVTNVDAWLLADYTRGVINTCHGAPGKLTSKVCDKNLKINGPTTTSKLYLNRTYGSEADSPGTPAEVFNLNAAAYLWLNSVALRQGITTTYQIEVPPRF